MAKRDKQTKFWDMFVGPRTKKEATEAIKRIKNRLNIHRFRGFIKTNCGD